jgi:hypothetical protein
MIESEKGINEKRTGIISSLNKKKVFSAFEIFFFNKCFQLILQENEKQLSHWEFRHKLLKRMKAGYDHASEYSFK